MNRMNGTRREFIAGAAAFAAVGASFGEETGASGLKVRFLGTGAADWKGIDERGEYRRNASVLVEGKVLIDYTSSSSDMLPKDARPETIFYTHSHGDHYHPESMLKLGSVRRVYVSESWVAAAKREIAAAADGLGVAAPEVSGLAFTQSVTVDGVRFTSLPANHFTGRPGEHCSMYLVEKGASRLLYATDTSGIPVETAAFIGIDTDNVKPRPITGLVMEATMGVSYADNFRIFTHSSVATVAQIARVLESTGCYRPRHGQKIWLTHIARTLHGTHREIAATAPAPLAPAYDGQEVVF